MASDKRVLVWIYCSSAGGYAGGRGTHAVGDVGAVQIKTVLQEPPPVLRHQATQLPLNLTTARKRASHVDARIVKLLFHVAWTLGIFLQIHIYEKIQINLESAKLPLGGCMQRRRQKAWLKGHVT